MKLRWCKTLLLIATNTSPLDDITEMMRVRFVMRDGKVYLGSRPLQVASN